MVKSRGMSLAHRPGASCALEAGNRGVKHSMFTLFGALWRARSDWHKRFSAPGFSGGLAGVLAIACTLWLAVAPSPAAAADPAVKFMAKVGHELMAAARAHSPKAMAKVVERYSDVSYIGLYSLGSYRKQLPKPERASYYGGMVRFISRYAASEAPKYPVTKVKWADRSVRGASGLMVDSTVTLGDGSVYEVRWLLSKRGGDYKVRDAMVMGFWMTPFLRQLFENYIAENGGNPRALVTALSR